MRPGFRIQAQPVLAVLFFVSFVLFGTMIMLNLFIGVIMNGMDEAQRESVESKLSDSPVLPVLHLQERLAALQEAVAELNAAIVVLVEEEDARESLLPPPGIAHRPGHIGLK